MDDKKLQFPLVFAKCPVCGSELRIANEMKKELVAEGKVGEGIRMLITGTKTPMFDPNRAFAMQIVPIIVAEYDICGDCGCFYCTRVERHEGQVEVGQPPPGMRGFGSPRGDPRLS